MSASALGLPSGNDRLQPRQMFLADGEVTGLLQRAFAVGWLSSKLSSCSLQKGHEAEGSDREARAHGNGG